MSSTVRTPASRTRREVSAARRRPPHRTAVSALVIAGVLALGAAGYQLQWEVAPSGPVPPLETPGAPSGGLGVADGVVPEGVTVFDDEVPAVTNLEAELLAALRRAGSDAADDGVPLEVNSGWRSHAYQELLLWEAVAEHGSEAAAARWVAPPERSAHVSGDAVDIGGAGSAWLARHGAAYGLCQIYDNEPWHIERRPDAVDHGCPARYADPTEDPRMRA